MPNSRSSFVTAGTTSESAPPTPLLLKNMDEDAEGVYGRVWLCNVLKNLVQLIGSAENIAAASKEMGAELDKNVEAQLAMLWDISSEERVQQSLSELGAIELLAHVLQQSGFPRLCEMILGVLANLAHNTALALQMSTSMSLRNASLQLFLGCYDPPTLAQAARLLASSVWRSAPCSELWLPDICSRLDVVHQQLVFVLSSGTHAELLHYTLAFLGQLMGHDDVLCAELSTAEMLDSVLAAHKELGLAHKKTLWRCFYIYNIFSQQYHASGLIVARTELLSHVCTEYLEDTCDEDLGINIIPVAEREAALFSVFRVLTSLLRLTDASQCSTLRHPSNLNYCLQIAAAAHRHTDLLDKTALMTNLREFLLEFFSVLNENDNDVEPFQKEPTPSWLLFLNKSCLEEALSSLRLLLNEENDMILRNLRNICKRDKLDRLAMFVT